MCAIVGALLANVSVHELDYVNNMLNHILNKSFERGRDGWGYVIGMNDEYSIHKHIPNTDIFQRVMQPVPHKFFNRGFATGNFIANMRAEPTTEYVKEKRSEDQQPYSLFPFHVVHNGTIANDKVRRTNQLSTKIDSAAIPEFLNTLLGDAEISQFDTEERLRLIAECFHALQGSWASILLPFDHTNELYLAVNYRPIWYITTKYGFFFASSRSYFPESTVPQMIPPYTQHSFFIWEKKPYHHQFSDFPTSDNNRVLVVCSGGLDSTVAAAELIKQGAEVELIHFQYGSRAQGQEVISVHAIAERLGVPVHCVPLPVYKPTDSPLLQADSVIAGGEAGAEFAYEWVPARNLLMLSVATVFAEVNDFNFIALGNNLEEAGAYPDNEPEFINRFNDMLPFAVGANRSVRVLMPVGNLMKHEIVAMGLQNLAPMDVTWSCYRNGEKHCGKCGPCFMRRTAFEINQAVEVIDYEE